VSSLANYKLDGCLVERLMTLWTALDRDVEIVIRNKPRSRRAKSSWSPLPGNADVSGWLFRNRASRLRPFQTIV
jgi:hypothetical protein